MKTILFTCETPAGMFWIRPEPAGRVQLGIGRRKLKTYRSATAAALAVAERRTGFAPWDESRSERPPRDLHAWKRPSPRVANSRASGAVDLGESAGAEE